MKRILVFVLLLCAYANSQSYNPIGKGCTNAFYISILAINITEARKGGAQNQRPRGGNSHGDRAAEGLGIFNRYWICPPSSLKIKRRGGYEQK